MSEATSVPRGSGSGCTLMRGVIAVADGAAARGGGLEAARSCRIRERRRVEEEAARSRLLRAAGVSRTVRESCAASSVLQAAVPGSVRRQALHKPGSVGSSSRSHRRSSGGSSCDQTTLRGLRPCASRGSGAPVARLDGAIGVNRARQAARPAALYRLPALASVGFREALSISRGDRSLRSSPPPAMRDRPS